MKAPWTSTGGTVLRDVVPAELRRRWVAEGHCANVDLFTLFRAHAVAHPDRAAVVDESGTVDYAALDRRARGVAAGLTDAGLSSNDIIAIQAPNGWRAVVAELAVAAIGAVALPIPAGHGLQALLRHARADACIDADLTLTGPDAATSLQPWLDAGEGLRPTPVDAEAPARILTTSGTEAEPKLIAYSHNAMAGGRGNYLRALHPGPDPMRNLILVPLSSSYGSCGTAVTLARHGGTVVLLDRFSAAEALRAITAHRPTLLFAVPTMLARMAAEPAASDEDLSSLRAVVSSGAALPPETALACRERFVAPVVNVYGSADGMNCIDGRPAPDVAGIRILARSGGWAAPGEVGEICALGPMTPLCYVNAPDLDRRYRLAGGWVRSGDRGLIDHSGRLRVVGRLKQVVIRGGFTISPAEIERELGAHPAVVEVACVGVADPDLGERLCACVVPRVGTSPLVLSEITGFLEHERGLDRRKLPELLLSLPELPLGPTGKVCRRTLSALCGS